MQIIINLLVNAIVVFGLAYFLPGIVVDNFITAIFVAIILGVLNTFIKPVLVLLTLPITIVTLGLFVFVINALLVLLVTVFVHGFQVDGFMWALVFALVLSLVSAILNTIRK